MEKRCFSVKTPDFEKAIKSLGRVKIEKMLEKIKKLEDMENDHNLLPQGIRTPELAFGKSLAKMGKKNIYVLELGDDRAMAIIHEKDNKKIYLWFWGGSHEDYNKKLKAKALHDSEMSVTSSQTKVIEEKLDEIKKENKNNTTHNTSGTVQNIEKIRDKYNSHNNVNNNSGNNKGYHNNDKNFHQKKSKRA